MRYKKSVLRILLLYFVGTSIPGLLGIEPQSGLYSLYQAGLFCGVALYTFYSIIRYRTPASSSALIFAVIYSGLLSIAGVAAIFSALQSNVSITSIAQLLLPIVIALTFLTGYGGARIERDDLYNVMGVVVLFLFLCSVYNIVVNFSDIISLSTITNSYEVDIKGFFANRNVFGYMMALGISLATYLMIQTKKWGYLIPLIVMAISLVATMSRGGILFAIISVGLFLLVKYKMRMFVPVLLFAGTAAYLSSQTFVQENLIRSDNGDTGRSSLREFGIDYFKEHNILTGSGQGAIDAIIEKYGHNSYHNLYIESLATQGLVGIIAVISALILSYRNIRIIKSHDRELGTFLLILLFTYALYVSIEALPLFYATPNSVLTTYLLVMLPLMLANSYRQPPYDAKELK